MRGDVRDVSRLLAVALVSLGVGWFGPQPDDPLALVAALGQPREGIRDLVPPSADDRAGWHAGMAPTDDAWRTMRDAVPAVADGRHGSQPGNRGRNDDAPPTEMDCLPAPPGVGVLVTGFQPLDDAALADTGISDQEQVALREITATARADYEQARRLMDAAAQRARHDLRQEITDRLGTRAYDAYLWASGQHNRLQVLRVVQGSAADAAGLQAGDRILRYDGRPVFDYADLRAAPGTAPAERMELRWQRGDAQHAATLPAADLGFVAIAQRLRPTPD